MFHRIIFIAFLPFLVERAFSYSTIVESDIDFLASEQQWLNAENYGSISFKNSSSEIKKSPGSVTIISQREIREMGAKGILDVLDTVPGISSWYGAYNQRVSARGILRTASQDILFMINGLPVTSNYIGSGLWSHFNISLEHIKRIEVIRGPSSSIYGANAFSGIINIITFDGSEINGIKLSQRLASYNSKKTSLLAGKKFDNGFELAAHASFYETLGYKGRVNSDRQSQFDDFFNADASLAPSRTENNQRRLDLGLKIKYEDFFIDTSYARLDRGGNVGIFDALGEKNNLENSDGYINTGYSLQVTDSLTTIPSVYYHRTSMHNYISFLPNNSKIWADFSDFSQGLVDLPNGIKGVYNTTNERVGFRLDNSWKLSSNYQVLFGFEYEKMRQFNSNQLGTHYFDGTKIVVLDKWQKIPKEFSYLPSASRDLYAFYLENVWDITSELRLTYGGRYDSYQNYHN
ncbi:MAG: TonB-dependent receptor plug domain-containing protein, partial [Lentisphaeria bacterium]